MLLLTSASPGRRDQARNISPDQAHTLGIAQGEMEDAVTVCHGSSADPLPDGRVGGAQVGRLEFREYALTELGC